MYINKVKVELYFKSEFEDGYKADDTKVTVEGEIEEVIEVLKHVYKTSI